MKKSIKLLGILFAFSFVISSCGDDDPVDGLNSTLDLSITGLENLGDDYAYEGWIMVNGTPLTTGVFDVNDNGELSKSSFEILSANLDIATAFILTIEPKPDNDPAPSSVHILAGDFSGDDASLNINHGAALNNDFSDVAGKYILATPTDDLDTNEDSGVWFLDNSSGSPAVGLSLPALPAGWIYEGWAVVDGTPISTGTFSEVNAVDNAAPFSGANNGPPFPGEDFLLNAPSDLSFPLSLQGGAAVISVEPVPDNSVSPFLLKPLVGMISADAEVHTAYEMGQNLAFPTGSANKN